ncbi:MAG: hypothetical protein Hals2KO_15010 [Halioglobus sp.]
MSLTSKWASQCFYVSILTMAKEIQSYKFHYLLHSADLINDYLRVQLLPLEISPHQARVIKALERIGPVSQIDLAREFDIAAASMSTMTARLVARGLIKSEKDPLNAKRNIVSLTRKGRALTGEISRVWASIDAFMGEKIGTKDMVKLAELTRSLRDSLGGRSPGSKQEVSS